MKPSLFILCFFCLLSLHAQNQRKVDSLTQLIQQDKVHDTIKIKAYNDLGIQYAPSNPVLAREHINIALDLAESLNRERGIAGAYNCLGIVDYYQKDYDAALFHFNKAYEINVTIEHLWGQAAALNQMGAVQNLKDNYYAAIENFTKAGVIFESTQDTVAWANSIQNIGISYKRMGNTKKSIESYLKAIDLYRGMNDYKGIANAYINIGTILNDQKEYTKALEYFNIALPKIKESGNKPILGEMYKRMGISYLGLKEYPTAMMYFKDALENKKVENNKKTLGSIQSYIGTTYYEMEQYVDALAYQKDALKNLAFKNQRKSLTLNATAKTLLKLNRPQEAVTFAQEAARMSTDLNKLKAQKEAYHTLAEIAKEQGKNKEALAYYLKFQKLNDSLIVQNNEKEVRKLRTMYEVEKNELQIASQQKDIEILDNKNTAKNQWLLFGGISLIGFFISIILHRSRNAARRRQKLQEGFSQNLIEAQEEERTRVARELHDSVGQKLVLLGKKSQAIDNEEMNHLTKETLTELRGIARGLYPPALNSFGVTKAIEHLVNEMNYNSETVFTNDIEAIDEVLTKTQALHLYRIIQEVLSNIEKHANAKAASVTIEKKPNSVEAIIKDNGQGFNISENKSYLTSMGMKTLMERAKILNAQLKFNSVPAKGTTVTLHFIAEI